MIDTSKNIQLFLGDNREILKQLPDNSVDSFVSDPPYELGFMGKTWDNTGIVYSVSFWKEVLRVLKPGGHLISFGGSRTYHRMVCAIEDAGFEIRDQIMWVYGSGFPKSFNIGKAIDKLQGNEREIIGAGSSDKPETHTSALNMSQVKSNTFGGEFEVTRGNSPWEGWGTALKPAHEPIVLARKPLSEKTIAENVLRWGVGGLAIDNCRIKTEEILGRKEGNPCENIYDLGINKNKQNKFIDNSTGLGRFPANLIHDGSTEVVELFPNTGQPCGSVKKTTHNKGMFGIGQPGRIYTNEDGENRSAARFFYCAKASKSERNAGCGELEEKERIQQGLAGEHNNTFSKNSHPTVKPIALMKYLITLISREEQVILDPFMGSGTTGVACKSLNRRFIGIELDESYMKIASERIKNAGDNNVK